MRKQNIISLLAFVFVLTLGLVLTACDSGGGVASSASAEAETPLVFSQKLNGKPVTITISRTRNSKVAIVEPKIGDYYAIIENQGTANEKIMSEGTITAVKRDGQNHFQITFSPSSNSPDPKTPFNGTLNPGGTVSTDGALSSEGGKLVISDGAFAGDYSEGGAQSGGSTSTGGSGGGSRGGGSGSSGGNGGSGGGNNQGNDNDQGNGGDKSDDTSSVPTLAEQLSWLKANAQTGGNYTLTAWADESLAPHELSYDGKKNITITLKGNGSNRTVSVSFIGSMFTVESGVTLILDGNITLQGHYNNNDALVVVNDNSTLIMNSGSTITANVNNKGGPFYGGGGVNINSGGYFNMNGGTISGNTGSIGGGVYVRDAAFTMDDGTISGNTGSIIGGGVYVWDATYTMNGGTVSGNQGSGVCVQDATFTMSYGTISDNFAAAGGGVILEGRVAVFNMSGGTISKNTAESYGGGVYLQSGASFIKTGGIITGYASDPINGNVVRNSSGSVINERGHAVVGRYFWDFLKLAYKIKETTAGPDVNLSLHVKVPDYFGAAGSATWSGDWDLLIENQKDIYGN